MIKKKEELIIIFINKKSLNYKILVLIDDFYNKKILFKTYDIVLFFINRIKIIK